MTITTGTTHQAKYASDIDPFSDEHLQDPYENWAALRDIGPAAYLTKYDMWILTRYDQVREALGDHETFVSGRGVGMNPFYNKAYEGAPLNTDPPIHGELRKVFTDALRPKFIRKAIGDIERNATQLVDQVLERGTFDAVEDFAKVLPVEVVMDLVGFPLEGRENILIRAEGAFNAAGPQNQRVTDSLPKLDQLFAYLHEVATPDNLMPDGFGAMIYAAADRGEFPPQACIPIMSGYLTAALDTTITATASAMMLFAQHPEQWALLREDPSLVPSAFLETVRMESPVQVFSRVTSRDVQLEDIIIPEDSRVIHSYAAANRDPRHFLDPDKFDVTRNPVDTLAFDYGVHDCPGQSLSKMEAHGLFDALAKKVDRIELAGDIKYVHNNLTRGPSELPVRVYPR
ncbi:cytochrome P450 [Rhodococcus sp. T2V]|uniref:cytochrome P450 n=1 Tax=Rhodococcus sp. T2V TaxID=3034164 RepID=UPI0023E2BBFD|nr:cytochrome P450 [Rhodococcus sp. T2V]MDF3311090.1 cytochrome P450 [Rhodococcus sp. T2V]